jgi:hypothetical protein
MLLNDSVKPGPSILSFNNPAAVTIVAPNNNVLAAPLVAFGT